MGGGGLTWIILPYDAKETSGCFENKPNKILKISQADSSFIFVSYENYRRDLNLNPKTVNMTAPSLFSPLFPVIRSYAVLVPLF